MLGVLPKNQGITHKRRPRKMQGIKKGKRVCHKSMAHPLLCYLLYNPRSIVAYSKKGII